MPRLARHVFANIPHHVTQRGNRREDVFSTDEDRRIYLDWLKTYCHTHKVNVLAYCLMTNHIHLILVPTTEEGLQNVLKPLHMRYAQRLNRERGWQGHVWQGRYFSSPLDESYLWVALRYVERNPVRAKMVRKAERYPWSSAPAHCGLKDDAILTTKTAWIDVFEEIKDWSGWLAQSDQPEYLDTLRKHSEKGLPCGSERFIKRLEKTAGRLLHYRPQGRPRKKEKG